MKITINELKRIIHEELEELTDDDMPDSYMLDLERRTKLPSREFKLYKDTTYDIIFAEHSPTGRRYLYDPDEGGWKPAGSRKYNSLM